MKVSCDHCIIRSGFILLLTVFYLICGSCLAWSLALSLESGSVVLASQAADDLGLTCVNCPTVCSPRVCVLWLPSSTSWEQPHLAVDPRCLSSLVTVAAWDVVVGDLQGLVWWQCHLVQVGARSWGTSPGDSRCLKTSA